MSLAPTLDCRQVAPRATRDVFFPDAAMIRDKRGDSLLVTMHCSTFRHRGCSPAFRLAQPQYGRDSSPSVASGVQAIVEEGFRGRRIVVLGLNLWGSEGSGHRLRGSICGGCCKVARLRTDYATDEQVLPCPTALRPPRPHLSRLLAPHHLVHRIPPSRIAHSASATPEFG
jgi:hypothetical protein